MRGIRSGIAATILLVALAEGAVAAGAPLASLLVRHSDLRSGYGKNVAHGYVHAPQFPDGSPVSRAVLKRHGYLITYVAQFTDVGTHPKPNLTVALIQESGDKYRTVAGARWGYREMVRTRYPQAQSLKPARVGNEWAAFSIDLPESPGKEVDVFFRRKNYVVRVAVAEKSPQTQAALALARLVDDRIRAHG